MQRSRLISLLAIIGVVVSGPHIFAGLYTPLEKCLITIPENGQAEELSFGTQKDGAFPRLFTALLNELDANPLRKENNDRKQLLEQIASWQRSPSKLSPAEVASLGAALARAGKLDDAIALLGPRGRDRVPDFRILANLAHVHASRGEWQDAYRWHTESYDTDFPTDLAGATPAQQAWLKKLERTHYRRWLQVHRERAAAQANPADEEVFPLFPARFVNDAGVYEPGKVAETERAKLPPDAIPAVQQLLLWAPWDTSLYWLLAELYAANGRLREAQIIFDQCADARQFANRKVFMAHRSMVRDAVAKLPPEKPIEDTPLLQPPAPKTDPAEFLPSRTTVILAGVVFGVLAAGLFVLQVRAAWRRNRHR